MLIIFGSLVIDSHFGVKSLPKTYETIHANYYQKEPGGRAFNQAISAVRSGAKVFIYGKVGDDAEGELLIESLQAEDVDISGITKTSQTPTGMKAYTQAPEDIHHSVYAPGANSLLSADDVPDDILNDKAIVLVQTDISEKENLALLQKAKKAGATTIMNLAPSIELSQKVLNLLDYLIVNHDEARRLSQQMDIYDKAGADNISILKIAEGLSLQGKLNCIITVGAEGSRAVTQDHKGWSVSALPIEELIDRSGAEDAYCGTLAACIDAGLHLPRALKRASVAGSLACTKQGIKSSFASQEEIEKHINEIEDPKTEDL